MAFARTHIRQAGGDDVFCGRSQVASLSNVPHIKHYDLYAPYCLDCLKKATTDAVDWIERNRAERILSKERKSRQQQV